MKTRIIIALALSAGVAFSVPAPASAQQSAGSEADNTKMNKEARDKGEETADKQGESGSDRKTTQQIRRAIVKNKSLSMYAHNVKIITRDGAVTLKGPVRSEKEKGIVEKAAARVAGEGNVTSELEIKPKKAK